MKVKRFFAPDMRQAMQRVRDEIGPDAVIVSNHRVAGGVEVVAAHEHEYEAAQQAFKRKRAVDNSRSENPQMQQRVQSNLAEELRKVQARIATAQEGVPEPRQKNRQLDGDDDELSEILDTLKRRQRGRVQPPPRVNSASEMHRSPETHSAPEKMAQPRLDPTRQERTFQSPADSSQREGETRETIDSLRQEIESLKSILSRPREREPQEDDLPAFSVPPESDLSEPAAPRTQRPRHEYADSAVIKVERRLERIGLGPQICRQLSATVADDDELDDAWRSALTRFSNNIPVMDEDFVERGGMIAFVGPTGVGKTTTIGKLAARYVLKHGSSSVALVTTDSYRIAAHEQLLTFGRILDVPVRVVDEKNSLDEVLLSLRSKRLVLIDTAGMNAHEPHTQAQLNMLEDVSVRLKKLLVLSCSSQRHVIESAYETYAPLGLSGCVLSKLDESGNLGEALDLVMENGLSVSYVTDGQRVPDDIDVAHKKDLVSRAVITAQKATRSRRVFHQHQQERLAKDEHWES
ncbi:flagellar biosynthesis protein FlhF [Amphritea pacifica]|uniref:Flagellar biosynthesis protein FlhF n=1 Tax=Amphritea pacifica TaxID=2811233 RepID=A0ABS2W550_9GAMM|nr:flagellar biosynthesis protein FlhF [Amphritea pacifica]MBN0986838.1 flagellar biosynthesis protein FlhF [Amphritea pacifica]MBN1005279.1 flagellar biosynthesis protein FlhF [Amphritea pacifica]